MTAQHAPLDDVRDSIARTANIAGRKASDVTLVAVSKTKSAEEIRPVLSAGHRDFGENRVQEAAEKWPALRSEFPDTRLHMIGQLQSNKADDAVALFDVIHSVDRPSLVKALGKAMVKADKRPDCFIQLDIGDEPQKGGCPLDGLPDLLSLCAKHDLPIIGLMCIPPVGTEAAPFFALMRKLAERHQLSGLSMGMSSDYETAIMVGATHVRVGSAIFGART